MKKIWFSILTLVTCAVVFAQTVEAPTDVMLSWNASEAEDLKSYRVWRSTAGSPEFKLIGDTTSIKFIDTTVDAATTYTYRVTALDLVGNESEPSSNTEFVFNDVEKPAIVRVTRAETMPGEVHVGITIMKEQ